VVEPPSKAAQIILANITELSVRLFVCRRRPDLDDEVGAVKKNIGAVVGD
jgi:hypothetical protein